MTRYALQALVVLITVAALFYLLWFWFRLPVGTTADLLMLGVLALLALGLIAGALWFVFRRHWLRAAFAAVLILAAILGLLSMPVTGWRLWLLGAVALIVAALVIASGTGRAMAVRWQFWAALAAFLIIGLWLPWRLIWWVPGIETFLGQLGSAVLRFALAGLLFSGSLVAFSAVTRERTPA